MADHEPPANVQSPDNPKKPFEPPRLQVYGDIAALTRKIGRTGVGDGGSGAKTRTSV